MRLDADLGGIGLPGVLGLGLLFFAASFYFSALAPAFPELERLRAEEQQLALPAREAPASGAIAAADAPASLEQFPAPAEVMELFDRLQAAAERNGLALDRATYNVVRADKQATLRYEVTLPLRGGYPNLRTFLRDALALAPSARLDSLSLQRARASDAALEASVRLSYFFLLK